MLTYSLCVERQLPTDRLREALYEPADGLPRQKGLLSRARKACRLLANTMLERDMDTAASAIELDHFHRDRIWYVPSDWLDLRRALRGVEVGPQDVFVDFGSGKGRMVYQAARLPFGRVVGVEISQNLNRIAHENLERRRDRLSCQQIELVTADAVDFSIPDGMTFAYLYHPFSGQTFRTVIDNIVESLDKWPRQLTLIYQAPLMGSYVLSTGRFQLVRVAKYGRDSPRRMDVYHSRPPQSTRISTG